MSTHNNNGMFDKIRQTVAASQGKDPLESKSTINNQVLSTSSVDTNIYNQQQLELVKQQLMQELDAKYQKQTQTYLQEQEANLKRAFKQEREQYEKFVKEKYEHIARAALREREQQLFKQVQQKITTVKTQEAAQTKYTQRQQQLSSAEWQLKVDRLQQELQQLKIRNKLEIETNIAQTRKEQEQALRAELTYSIEQKYVKQFEAQQQIAAQEISQKIANALQIKEQELKQLYISEVASHDQLSQARHEQEIALAVRTALNEQEQQADEHVKQIQAEHMQQLQQLHSEQTQQLQQLQAEHTQQQKQLSGQTKQIQAENADHIHAITISNKAKIAELNAEIAQAANNYEVSMHEYKVQLEQDLHAKYADEYDVKLEREKAAMIVAKDVELQQLLTQQRKIISLQLEEENNIVLKYKERDLEVTYAAHANQETLRIQREVEEKARAEQAIKHESLLAELESKYAYKHQALEDEYVAKQTELHQNSKQEILEARMTADYSSKQQAILAARVESLQAELEQERSALVMQHTDETKALLQQQQRVLLEQYTQDLNTKLSQLTEQKALEQQQALAALERQLRIKFVAESAQHNDHKISSQQQNLIDQQLKDLNTRHEQEKVAALRYLEEKLKAEFAMQMELQKHQLQVQFDLAAQNTQVTNKQASTLQTQQQTIESQRNIEAERAQIEQNVRAEFTQQFTLLESSYESEKQVALDKLRQELSAKHSLELQKIHADSAYEKTIEMQNVSRQEREILEREQAQKLLQREEELRAEFQEQMIVQRKQITVEMNAHLNSQVNEQIHHTIEAYKQKISEQLQNVQMNELELAQDQLKEQYAIKLQQQIEIMRLELEQEKVQYKADYKSQLDSDRQEIKAQLQADLERKFEQRFAQESKKLSMKLAQERAIIAKELAATLNQEKEAEIAEHESNLRDSLYKEMVKQKEYIQAKSAAAQENALQELKRRLESQHKQEVERVKQGFFEVKDRNDFSQTVAQTTTRQANFGNERGVEQLAERILSKFGTKRDE